jgi:hypothetical protein
MDYTCKHLNKKTPEVGIEILPMKVSQVPAAQYILDVCLDDIYLCYSVIGIPRCIWV